MPDTQIIKGLACPKCGGIVPVPEGQAIVICPYCDMRSLVRGERGVRRYQVTLRATREQALTALSQFFGNIAVARDARAKSRVTEVFLVHLPFWTLWSRALGWAFGQKKVSSGRNTRYEPREVRLASDMVWAGAACDVEEFGVTSVQLTDQTLEPFNSEGLHASGMVFEPTSSVAEAREAAGASFDESARRTANLDRLNQLFLRFVNRRFGLTYYPMWTLRYVYRNRSFQVVVDGFTGKVLYGKAPGSTLYRAGALSLGMALGAFLIVDVPTLFLRFMNNNSNNSSGSCAIPLVAIAAGVACMSYGYRAFRYGEQYELNRGKRQGGLFRRGSQPAGDTVSSAVKSITESLEILK